MTRWIEQHPFWGASLLLLIIAALAYLPNLGGFGFYKDDWYLMYAARVNGPDFFTVIFAGDRPARAPLQYVLYTLFGENLLLYHLSAYIYRAIGAIALWLTMNMLWPAQKRISLLAATLFLVYPGFLSQVNAVDFQAHLFSLMTAMLSIALSLRAWQETRATYRVLLILFTVLTGWVYLSLMEYFIGIEVFRFALFGIMAWRKGETLRRKVLVFVQSAWPFLFAPLGFLIWRLFIFESERRATDIGAQLSLLFSSPITGIWWLIYLLQDTINVLLSAWIVPLYNLAFALRLRDFLPALLLGLLSAGIVLLVWRQLPAEDEKSDWRVEAFVAGFLSIVGGLFPVILANRHVNFSDYSRYTLPALAGAMLVTVAWLTLFKSQAARAAMIGFLIACAVMTHYANSVVAVQEAAATRNFWWQVAWRIPKLQPGTTLVADYPNISIQEDYFIWGPVNQIYFSEPQNQAGEQVNVPLPALVLNAETLPKLDLRRGQAEQVRRGIYTLADYRRVLILTQPAANACVRVIDGNSLEFSQNDRLEIRLVASASRLDGVLIDAAKPQPPAAYFGPEPPHDWCYYYQKAALARQTGDWEKVIRLGEQALAEGHYPADKIEWLPFMQAHAALGQKEKLRRFVSIMAESPYIQSQACVILSASATDPATLTYIKESFCK